MLQSASIEYKHDGYLCEGFAVWDEAGTKRPAFWCFRNGSGSANTLSNVPKCLATSDSTLS